jgi:membrane protein DedA with SNARE-associated domain
VETVQGFVEHFTYLGIFAALLLGSLGVPIPEEMSIIVAAFLTAGNSRVPVRKSIAADAGAATFGVPFVFGLAYLFTDQIEAVVADVHRVERWLVLAGLLVLGVVLVVGVWRWKRRVGKERLDEERTEGHSLRPWELPAVRPLEDTPSLEAENICVGAPAQERMTTLLFTE